MDIQAVEYDALGGMIKQVRRRPERVRRCTEEAAQYLGKRGVSLETERKLVDNPFLDICRSQIDVSINGDCNTLSAETRDVHWMASCGNYLKEVGYALREVGVDWMNLTPPQLNSEARL